MLIVHLLLFLLLVPELASAIILLTETTDRTYCEDEGRRRDWEERTANNPDDSDLQTLHALRLGLCVKIQREDLAVDQATDMFERMRHRLIEQRREQSAAEPKPGK
jgi:hypothetical protein